MAEISKMDILTKKMGLDPVKDASLIGSLVARSVTPSFGAKSPLDTLFDDYQKNAAPRYDGLFRALGQKLKSDPAFLDKLDGEMKQNPALEARLSSTIQKTPEAVATMLGTHKTGQLKQELDRLDADAQSAPVVAAASPAKTAKAASVSIFAENTAAVTGSPVGTKPHHEPKGKSHSRAAPRKEEVADPGNGEILGMAFAIEAYVGSNFRGNEVLNSKAANFRDVIAKNPKLQRSIAERLNQDPEFKNELLKGIGSKDAMDPRLKKQFEPFLGRILDDPFALADEKGFARVKGDYASTKRSMSMSGVTNWLNDTLGIRFNVGDFLAKISNMFQGAFSQFGNFFGQIQGGEFKSMRNSGHSLFGAMGAAMNNAAYNVQREGVDMQYLRAVSTAKDRSFVHTEITRDADGKEIRREVPNTIEVKSINGATHKIVPSYGLNSIQLADGNYELSVATNVDRTGKVTDMKHVVVSELEGRRYFDQLKAAGVQVKDQNFGPNGTITQREMSAPYAGQPGPYNNGNVMVMRYDPQSGQPIGPDDLSRRPPVASPAPHRPGMSSANDPAYRLENNG